MQEEPDSGYPRIENQIAWYDKKSQFNQVRYKLLKTAELVAAALIPLTAGLSFLGSPAGEISAVVSGVLGAVVVVLVGVQQLNRYHHNWVTYRSTCEALRHEKYLFIERSGPYDIEDDVVVRKELANRVESLVSSEHAKWVGSREESHRRLVQDDSSTDTSDQG